MDNQAIGRLTSLAFLNPASLNKRQLVFSHPLNLQKSAPLLNPGHDLEFFERLRLGAE